MDLKQLEDIANRKTTCHPFGETVSLSRAERDQLVAMARRYAWLRDGVLVDGEVNDSLYVRIDSPDWPNRWALVGVELDHAIDAAMAAEIGKNMEKV
ncbi:hypothetical protein [Achromobacter xylosoxidans]|uniref:hypothetical protein n=1 Tax=Alcaligenes xylosoxydans xylosoxydans TaxID=85698 RepID=UPI001F133831|nr:hypothetical protein [Achromobacter xylosoxidans]